MATIEARRISKYFNDVNAVDNIDLTAAEGEFLVLLGPSGCGKTTLMRMIAGLERPSSGDILIDGSVVTNLTAPDTQYCNGLPELCTLSASLGCQEHLFSITRSRHAKG